LGEGRHEATGYASANVPTDIVFSCEGDIDGVAEGDGCASSAVRAVAGGAVLFIERGEVEELIGTRDFGAGTGTSGDAVTAARQDASRSEEQGAERFEAGRDWSHT
jgi:hypothetical protein